MNFDRQPNILFCLLRFNGQAILALYMPHRRVVPIVDVEPWSCVSIPVSCCSMKIVLAFNLFYSNEKGLCVSVSQHHQFPPPPHTMVASSHGQYSIAQQAPMMSSAPPTSVVTVPALLQLSTQPPPSQPQQQQPPPQVRTINIPLFHDR